MIITVIISFFIGIIATYTFLYKLFEYYQTQRRAIARKNKTVGFLLDRREDARLLHTGFRKDKVLLRTGVKKRPKKLGRK
jgi:hypothetical protein